LNVLDEVLADAARAGRAGVVVFDLDSTLLDNRVRQARILREFGAEKKLAPLLDARASHWTSWSIEEAMRAAQPQRRRGARARGGGAALLARALLHQ
jgi:hypothetical protein